MKKLILIVLPLLLLLAGGGGAAYYFLILAPAQENAEPEPPPPPPDPVLVELDGMTIPVIRQGSVRKYILVEVTLQVKDQEARQLARSVMPRLKDQMYSAMHKYFASLPLDAPISTNTIKKYIHKIAEKNLGPENFNRVLIEGVFEKKGG